MLSCARRLSNAEEARAGAEYELAVTYRPRAGTPSESVASAPSQSTAANKGDGL